MAMVTFTRKTFLYLLQILIASLFVSVLAQDDDQKEQPKVHEVLVVTATKTGETPLAKTPISISAISSTRIEAANIEDLKDIAGLVPGLSIAENEKYGQVYLRGVGTQNVFVGSDPSVTIHYDGVYLSRPSMIFSEFLDLERIEVLRGPQGTLYGRNSAGGNINLISKRPGAEVERDISLSYGSHDRAVLKGRLAGPLGGDKLFGDFSFLSINSQGYVDNLNPDGVEHLNDEGVTGFRGSLLYLVNDKTDISLSLDYTKQDDRASQYKPSYRFPDGSPSEGPIVIEDPYSLYLNSDPHQELVNKGISAKVNVDLGGNRKFTSITAYRGTDLQAFDEDVDFTDIDEYLLNYHDEQTQLSQEFNLSGSSDRYTWVAGLFYFSEDIDYDFYGNLPFFAQLFGLSSLEAETVTRSETLAYAAFFQGTYEVSDRASFTAGLRYSYEEKDFSSMGTTIFDGFPIPDFNSQQVKDWNALTPTVVFDYKLSDDTMAYARVARGFKSGGFNGVSAAPAFEPEFLWSYEGGFKSDWDAQNLNLDISVFHYDYQDLQVQGFVVPTEEFPNPQIATSNAAQATIQGLELELTGRPQPSFYYNMGLAYLDATYDEYVLPLELDPDQNPVYQDVSGNRLNSSPEWTYHLDLQYSHELSTGKLTIGSLYKWQDDVFYTPFNQEATGQSAYGLLNARIAFAPSSNRWSVAVIGKNLTDEVYYTSTADYSVFGVFGTINPPRTMALQFDLHF